MSSQLKRLSKELGDAHEKEVQVQVEVEVSAQKAKNQAMEFQATCDMLTVEKERLLVEKSEAETSKVTVQKRLAATKKHFLDTKKKLGESSKSSPRAAVTEEVTFNTQGTSTPLCGVMEMPQLKVVVQALTSFLWADHTMEILLRSSVQHESESMLQKFPYDNLMTVPEWSYADVLLIVFRC